MYIPRFFALACLLASLCSGSPLFSQPLSDFPLDDTPGIVDLEPDSSHVLACAYASLTVDITVTDARVFDLQFSFDPARLQIQSITPGSEPTLNVLPPLISGSSLTLDAFFHPNFTGTTNLVTISYYVNPVLADDTTTVYFEFGQGYSGTADVPEPIVFSGDSAVIYIEGTPPLPPNELLISPLAYPAHDDSILLRWHPVYYDFDGDTVVNPLYVVYREDVINDQGVYDSVFSTPDTFYYDDFLIFSFDPGDTGSVNVATFKVHARKTQP